MDFSISAEDIDILRRFREYLRGFSEEMLDSSSSFDILDTPDQGYEFRRQLGKDGWLGLSWPLEYGGRGTTALQEWLISEELASRRLPLPGLSVTSIGPTLIRVGTEQQKSELLSGLLDGSKLFCLGYTEPEAGSDLASLRTTARRYGNHYVVNGQKIYTSGAHHASHMWLAARTNPDASKWEGISIFIVPIDTDGVTVTPLTTQAGGRSNQVFLDDVVVPAENLVGLENQGWDVVKMALDFERTSLVPWGGLARDLWDLADVAGLLDVPESTAGRGAFNRLAWAELAVDTALARTLLLRTVRMVDSGQVPRAEASMAKIWLTETRMRLASHALDMLGPAGQLVAEGHDRSDTGEFAWLYLFSPVKRFGGGTNEIQRRIVARERLAKSGW